MPAPPNGTEPKPLDPAAPSRVGLSDWITYPRSPGCCGPTGLKGPIGSEVYFYTGMDFPIGPGDLGKSMNPGWVIGGGGRVLFFNPEVDAAWTVDLGVSNFSNFGDHKRTATLFNVPTQQPNGAGGTMSVVVPELTVTPSDLNRTYFNGALGREWYLMGTGDSARNETTWRAGVDVGGRWGSERLNLDEFRHRTKVIEGIFVSLHSEVEVPCGNVFWQAGFRLEWGYTWSDILQSQNDADIQEINLLFTLGVRF
jgi:hypothetical protein